MQRIFNCDKIQDITLTQDKVPVMNILYIIFVYMDHLLCHIYMSYKLSN